MRMVLNRTSPKKSAPKLLNPKSLGGGLAADPAVSSPVISALAMSSLLVCPAGDAASVHHVQVPAFLFVAPAAAAPL